MDLRQDIVQDVMTMSELIADAIIKKTSPVRDDLSTRDAYRDYGRKWVLDMERQGRAHSVRKGNMIVFSRHELDTIRAVEKAYAKDALARLRH